MAKSESSNTYKRLVMVSLTYFTISLFILTSIVYAWFTMTNTNRANLVAGISGVEAEYQFYIYQDTYRNGSSSLTLENNVCTPSKTDECYELITNPTVPTLIPGFVAPGERFSFAIRIVSVGASSGRLRLDFGGLTSQGFDLDVNKIQSAFSYEVTKISYIDMGIESSDQKDQEPIVYYSEHFVYDNNGPYPLVESVPMGQQNGQNSIIVIYFDLYFDPFVYGFDIYGEPYTNSNIFMNQIFTVNHIFMTVAP